MLRFISSYVLTFLLSMLSVNVQALPNSDELEPEVNNYRSFRILFKKDLKENPEKYGSEGKLYRRSLKTLRCGDCDHIPKVPGAGQLFVDEATGMEYQLMHNGVKVKKGCYYGKSDYWSINLIQGLCGHHEPQEEKAFYEVLKFAEPNSVMLELGSHWAYYSLWFKKEDPQRRTILLEPNKKLLALSKKHYDLNNLSGEFVWGYTGKSECKRHIDQQDDFFKDIPSIDIESLLDEKQVESLFILHADIQGAELNMLKSIEQPLLKDRISYCFISTHSKSIHQGCLEFLKSTGMQIVVEHNTYESYSVDGLIVAKSPLASGPTEITVSKAKRKKNKNNPI